MTPMPIYAHQCLNPNLYQQLVSVFGVVNITNQGDRGTVSSTSSWVEGRRMTHNDYLDGEHYSVNCPYCRDKRQRLSIDYRYATPDEQTGEPIKHLAKCFNEDCLADIGFDELYHKIFPIGRRRPTSSIVTQLASKPAARPDITLPASFCLLSDLPANHAARAFVLKRKFNPRELSEWWYVGYVHSDETSRPKLFDRLAMPVHASGTGKADAPPKLVGWQARTLSQPSPNKKIRKYLNAAGFSKSKVVYGSHRATLTRGPLAIVEGPTDVWRLGGDAVALFGKTISTAQLDLILSKFIGRPLVIALDADAQHDAEKLRDRLREARKRVHDTAPVTVCSIPADIGDVGAWTRQKAWQAIYRAAGYEYISSQLHNVLQRETARLIVSRHGVHIDATACRQLTGEQGRKWQRDLLGNGSAEITEPLINCRPTFTFAETGRLLASEPALQTLPRKIRHIVVAPPGFTLLYADHKQFELRVLAHFTQCHWLLDQFANNHCPYTALAADLESIEYGDVTTEKRALFKRLLLAVIYGQRGQSIGELTGFNEEDGEGLRGIILDEFLPGFREWQSNLLAQAVNDGYVRTLRGHIRFLPDLHAQDGEPRSRARRTVVNTLIQGSAADILNWQISRLQQQLPKEARICLPVHDAVLLEIPNQATDVCRNAVRLAMEQQPPGFSVPLRVAIAVGPNWAQCK